MDHTTALTDNTDRLHTTELGAKRIIRNLGLTADDPVKYCRDIISAPDCRISRQGKNWYCEHGNVRITVNAYSYTIITAHIIR